MIIDVNSNHLLHCVAQSGVKFRLFCRSCSVRTPFRVFLDTQNIFWKPYRKRCQPTHQRKPCTTEDCNSVWIAVIETALDQPPAISEQVQNNDPLRLPTEVKEESIVMKQSIRDSEEANKSCKAAVIHDEKNKGDKVLDSDRTCSDDRDTKNISEVKKLHKNVNDQESFQCTECGKCFKLKDSYLRHMRIHKDERPFTCHICGKQFRDSGGLSRHLKDVHAKVKNFTCDLCGRPFASKATRDDHRRTHTGERPYICDSCGKTFKSKASLYIHSKLHTDEFPHVCSYCGKQFRRRQEMLAHVTTHTGEKNHTCDVCAKKFRVKSELARHKLVHSENKPFVCVKCGLAFRQKRYLNNHIKSRHTESLRAC